MADRVLYVKVGDGAQMTVPLNDWIYSLCHQRPEPSRGTLCDDRKLAAGVCESYLYLIQNCTKAEAWRRIKVMRAALAQTT